MDGKSEDGATPRAADRGDGGGGDDDDGYYGSKREPTKEDPLPSVNMLVVLELFCEDVGRKMHEVREQLRKRGKQSNQHVRFDPNAGCFSWKMHDLV